MRFAVFWDFPQRNVVVRYRRFGATYRSHLQGSSNTYVSGQPIVPTFKDQAVPTFRYHL